MTKLNTLSVDSGSAHVTFHPQQAGVTYHKETTLQEWQRSVQAIAGFERFSAFMLADALDFAEATFGEKIAYKNAALLTGKNADSLRNIRMTGKAFPIGTRNQALSLELHRPLVPLLKAAERQEKIAKAAVTTARPKRVITAAKRKAEKLKASAFQILAKGGTRDHIKAQVSHVLGKPKKKSPKKKEPNRKALADTHQENLENAADFISALTPDEIKKDGKAWLHSGYAVYESIEKLLGLMLTAGIIDAKYIHAKLEKWATFKL